MAKCIRCGNHVRNAKLCKRCKEKEWRDNKLNKMEKEKAIVDNLNNERVATLVEKEFKMECGKCRYCEEFNGKIICSFEVHNNNGSPEELPKGEESKICKDFELKLREKDEKQR